MRDMRQMCQQPDAGIFHGARHVVHKRMAASKSRCSTDEKMGLKTTTTTTRRSHKTAERQEDRSVPASLRPSLPSHHEFIIHSH